MRVDLNQKKRVNIAPPKPVQKAINSSDPTKYGATLVTPAQSPTVTIPNSSQFPTEAPVSLNDQINNYLAKPAYDMSQNNSGILGTVGKSLANDLKSLLRFGKGTVDFINPVETAKKLKDIPSTYSGFLGDFGAASASIKAAKETEDRVKAMRTAKGQQNTPYAPNAPLPKASSLLPDFTKAGYEATIPPAFQKAFQGKGYEAVQSVAEDPYQLAPLFLIGKQALESKTGKMISPKGEIIPKGTTAPKGSIAETYGATKVGNAIDTAISGTAKIITKPVDYATSGSVKIAKNLAEYGVSQATGLSPKTIKTIMDNPKDFTAKEAAKYTREGIGEEVKTQIDKRISELSDTGKAYEVIRNTPGTVKIPSSAVKTIFDKYKIGVDENGRIVTTQESLPLSATDQSGLQSFIDTFNTTELSNNAFLNARTALSNIAKYDATKTSASTMLARELRSTYDHFGKEQIPGLKNLDTVYTQERGILQQIKKDYLKPDGSFKDNAVSKIANLNKEGRQLVLDRLENIHPGIGKKIQMLNAFEDIQYAKGQKVGTYARAGLGLFGVSTMNIPAIIAAILSSPDIAVQIIRGYARLKNLPPAVTNKLIKEIIKILNADITKTKVGLSIENVNPNSLDPMVDTGSSVLNRLNKNETAALKEAAKSTPKDPLTQEALKYKSADEFVKAITHDRGGVGSGVEYSPAKRLVETDLNNTPLTDFGYKPSDKITIYRGVDRASQKTIQEGDYIALSHDLAKSYKGGEVISQEVPASSVRLASSDGLTVKDFKDPNNIHVEAVYNPKPLVKQSQLTDIYNKAHEVKANALKK